MWDAVCEDGSIISRYNTDGSENKRPPEWRIRQFHLYSLSEPELMPISVFVPKGAQFRFTKRGHVDATVDARTQEELYRTATIDVIYVLGWVMPDAPETACFTFVLPDGRIEQASDFNHITRYERNREVHPLEAWERRGPRNRPLMGQCHQELFAEAIVADEINQDASDTQTFGQHLEILAE